MKPGRTYKFPNGTVVLCTNDDLETFSGVILIVGKKDKTVEHEVGYVFNNFNSDYKGLKEIKMSCKEIINTLKG